MASQLPPSPISCPCLSQFDVPHSRLAAAKSSAFSGFPLLLSGVSLPHVHRRLHDQPSCSADSRQQRSEDLTVNLRRRDSLLLSTALIASSPFLETLSAAPAASAAPSQPVAVGKYLPQAEGDDGFVVFTPAVNATPALRAGNVSPYTFYLPPTWTQERIANILSGNYCQPKCAEPWIEVKFSDTKQGSLQVVASPMVRLTNKLKANIEEIGEPETIIAALGPFVTGDSYDPDELVEVKIRKEGEQTYYEYTLDTPYARSGSHNLASATAKGNTVLLLVLSASDQQWNIWEPVLRKLLGSFQV